MRELPQPGSLIGGRYRIDALVGRGGMGAVLAATNMATGGQVAIKYLLPDAIGSEEAVARFIAEARQTARIEHPNVITVYDVGNDRGAPFLVMELLRGEPLRARLARERLTPAEATRILVAVCRGVAEAHAEGIVHRDLKPDNIFLCAGKDGSARPPKVLDFGVSKLLEGGAGPSLTQTGIAVGTPHYMAPEQFDAPKRPDPRVDVYSLGVVLYQMLTGKLPYDAEGMWDLIRAITRGEATPIRALAPDVPPELEAIAMRAMSARADARPASARELLGELEAIEARISSAPLVSQPLVPATAVMTHAPMPVTRPASWAPPLPAPVPPTAAHVPREMPPARRGLSVGVVLAIGGVLVALTAIAVSGVIAFVAMNRTDHHGGSATASTSPSSTDDPLQPEVSLTFQGACTPSFDGSLAVSRYNDHLTVACLRGDQRVGVLVVAPGQAQMIGTHPLSTPYFEQHGLLVGIMIGDRQWWDWAVNGLQGPDPIGGTASFRSFDAERGVMDVTLDDVALQAVDGSICRVNGRVITRGLIWAR